MARQRDLSELVAAPPLKRARPVAGAEKPFPVGAITRVTLHNFVTFDAVQFEPGPALNCICGPNGSGKSSIACAINLGLAGHTRSLGRAEKIGDYVKRGKEKGSIEIDLYTPDEPSGKTTILRHINRKGNTSQWRINQAKCSENDVVELVKSLNIQVDNLCQFLAQEKVSSFAQLDSVTLLKAVEESAEDSQLLEQHVQVIQLKKEETLMARSGEEMNKQIERLKRQRDSLEDEVRRIKAREQTLGKIEMIKKKKVWLEYMEVHDKAVEMKERLQEVKANLKEAQEAHSPLIERIKNAEDETKSFNAAYDSEVAHTSDAEKKRERITSSIDGLVEQQEQLFEKLKDVDRVAAERMLEIDALVARIEKEEALLGEMPTEEESKLKLQKLDEEATAIRGQMGAVNSDVNEIDARFRDVERRYKIKSQEVSTLKNVKEQRLRALTSVRGRSTEHGKSLADCMNWIESHRSSFEGQVYGPIGVEVSIKVGGAEKYVEHAMKFHVRCGFVVDNDADWKLLSKMKTDCRWKGVNVFTTPTVQLAPAGDLPQNCYWLSDAIDGPAAVVQCILAQTGMHHKAFATGQVSNPRSLLRRSHNDVNRPSTLYTPDSLYLQSFSRYSDSESCRVDSIVGLRAQLFAGNVNAEELKALQQELDALSSEGNTLKTQKMELQATNATAKKKFDEILARQRETKTLMKARIPKQRKIASMKDDLYRLNEMEDSETEKACIRKELEKHAVDSLKLAEKLKDIVTGTTTALARAFSARVSQLHSNAVVCACKEQLAKLDATLNSERVKVEEYKNAFKSIKHTAATLKAKAEKIADLAVYGEQLREDWLPQTADDCETTVRQLQAQADMMGGEMSTLRDYEKISADVRSLEGQQASHDERYLAHVAKMERVKNLWYPKLKDVVAKIDVKYGELFEKMKCKAKLELREAGEDYEMFGLDIYVQYRKGGELKLLKPTSQSGGERSVATMLFLLALQEVTTVPFRVVDEINQGMDANNERMVFQRVVECASVETTPQYFMITPKLLPNLGFSRSVTVLVVFNGQWNLPQVDLDLAEIISGRERLVEAEKVIDSH